MKLTDEQIAELAPDWATHYSHNSTTLTFSNAEKAVVTDFKGVYQCSEHDNEIGFTEEDKPIQSKTFNIGEYEFSDSIAEFEVEVCDTLVLKSHGSWFSFDKDDATAIAKHFKLTAEDLK